MKNLALIATVTLLLGACATPTPYSVYRAPVTPSMPVAEPDSDSGFSTEEEDRKADAALASAQQAYTYVQTAAANFTVGSAKCDDRTMAGTLSTLQSVDDVARQYMQMSVSAQDAADREAAMDVLDELNKVTLDGLLEVAKAYRSRKCYPYAKHIITEAKRIYAGPAYEGWIGAMDTELAAIVAQEPVTQAITKPATPTKSIKKRKLSKAAQSS
ncbi:hypothetical protein AB4Z32_16905 [Massilia sp. 2TAF26]|uniref:hypothetical protein n=1 Tax=Massilia sp. 2TAF26 TaxID=3233012 RepID=UPI003F96961C